MRYETTGAATRTVYPQVLFRAANGTPCLDCYQVAGATSSGDRLPAWRPLDLAKITAIEQLGGTIGPAPELNRRATKYAGAVIASV